MRAGAARAGGAARAARAEGADRSRSVAAARTAQEHAAAARLDVLRAHVRRRQLPRLRAEARGGRVTSSCANRAATCSSSSSESVPGRPAAQRGRRAAAAPRRSRSVPVRQSRGSTRRRQRPPIAGRAAHADGIREVRRLFQTAQNPPRWPMYIRQAKQFLRNVDATFDERKLRVRQPRRSAARLPARRAVPHRARSPGRDAPLPGQRHAGRAAKRSRPRRRKPPTTRRQPRRRQPTSRGRVMRTQAGWPTPEPIGEAGGRRRRRRPGDEAPPVVDVEEAPPRAEKPAPRTAAPPRSPRPRRCRARRAARRAGEGASTPRKAPSRAGTPPRPRRSVVEAADSPTRATPRSKRAPSRLSRSRSQLNCHPSKRQERRSVSRFCSDPQVVHADAEQAHRPAAGLGPLEQRHRARRDVVGSRASRMLRVAARDRREVRVAHLDRHGPAEQRLALQPRRVVARHLVDLRADLVEIGEVLRERVLGARRLRGAVRARPDDRRCRRRAAAASRPGCRPPRAAGRDLAVRTSTSRSMPRSRSRAAVTGPTPHSASTGSFWRKLLDALGRDHGQAVRLLPGRCDLRQELVRRDAGRRGQPGRVSESRAFSRCATRGPSGSPQAFSVTSRYASSSDSGSTSGVTRSERSRTPPATRPCSARSRAGR